MVEEDFRMCARTVGVEQRLATLILDCEKAMADFPEDGDRRWCWRLEDQRRRLLSPDLRMIVAITTRLTEERPALAPLVASAMKALVLKRPELSAFHDRLERMRRQAATDQSLAS